MNNPNASSLFHFTNSFDVLKAIVREGLMFAYSYEEHNFFDLPEEDFPSFKGIAIPMICFCNTPLSRVENHARVYGKYFVAIDKEFLMKMCGPILNAVIYYNSNNLARSIFCLNKTKSYILDTFIRSLNGINQSDKEKITDILSRDESIEKRMNKLSSDFRERINSICKFNFAADFILGLSKPIFGKNKLGEDVYLDEEREWRAFWMNDCIENLKWKYYNCKDEFSEEKDSLKSLISNSSDSHLTLPSIEWANMITSICVEKEAQIPELVDFILSSRTFFGCEDNYKVPNIKHYIISRITSFERLSKDI